MTDREKINRLKNEYENIEIPKDLEYCINKIHSNKRTGLFLGRTGIAAVIFLGVFVSSINLSPSFAESLSGIPVVNSVVRFLNIKTYIIKEDNMEAEINIPHISGIGDEEIEDKLNKQFIQEGQKEYDDFIKEINDNGHKMIKTSYEVKTDNEDIFSVIYTKFETSASSDIRYKTYTIDKKYKSVVSLKSLFNNEKYIEIISDYIKNEMHRQMESDESLAYFINDIDFPENNFEKIKADQTFYINKDGKLVILFNKYEVAPGYMGTPEFEIPTDIIKSNLLDRGIIK